MSNEWIENKDFVQPLADNVLVDVKLDGVHDPYYDGDIASSWVWTKLAECSVTHWRLHKGEKSLEDSFKGLETAYDQPESKPLDYWGIVQKQDELSRVGQAQKGYYTYPATKEQPAMKKSIETLVSDNFNDLSGKNITAEEVVQIVKLYELLTGMQK